MKLKVFGVFIPLIFLAFSGCSTRYTFKIDAISGGAISGNNSFYLISGDSEMKENDLRFKEAAQYVATALEGKGYRKSHDIASADMLIEVTFGISEPKDVIDVRHYPETYWYPGASFCIAIPIYDSAGITVGYQRQIVSRPPRSYTHWEEQINTSTVYKKELQLAAYDNRLGASVAEPQQLWSVIVTNLDYSENLREYLPYMVAASLPFIGEDTGRQVFMDLKQDDPEAAFIRNPDFKPSGT